MQEFVVEHLHPWRVYFRTRLGGVSDEMRAGLPEGVTDKIFSVTQRYADAVCIFVEHIEIWEAKLIRPLGAITQLQLYEMAFRKTPEFSVYKDWPISLHLLTPIRDEDLESLCEAAGISIVYCEPAWVTEYLSGHFRTR